VSQSSIPQPQLTFTRQPKVAHLIRAGVPSEVVPTYMALSDHASNKTGRCHPRMDSLARLLGKSVRTVQRHLHLLKNLGLVEFVERRRTSRGKFQSWCYRLAHVARLKKPRATGHGRARGPNRQTRRKVNSPPRSPSRGTQEARERKEAAAARRRSQMAEVFGPDAVS